MANLGDDTVMKMTRGGMRLAVVRTGDAPAALAVAGDNLVVVNAGSQTLTRIPLATGGATM